MFPVKKNLAGYKFLEKISLDFEKIKCFSFRKLKQKI